MLITYVWLTVEFSQLNNGIANGRYFDLVLSDGSVIPCIVGDSKGYKDRHIYGNSVFQGVANPYIVHYTSNCPSVIEVITNQMLHVDGSVGTFLRNEILGENVTIDKIVMYDYNILEDGPCFSSQEVG